MTFWNKEKSRNMLKSIFILEIVISAIFLCASIYFLSIFSDPYYIGLDAKLIVPLEVKPSQHPNLVGIDF